MKLLCKACNNGRWWQEERLGLVLQMGQLDHESSEGMVINIFFFL